MCELNIVRHHMAEHALPLPRVDFRGNILSRKTFTRPQFEGFLIKLPA